MMNETIIADSTFVRDPGAESGLGKTPGNLVHMMISDFSSQDGDIFFEGRRVYMVC